MNPLIDSDADGLEMTRKHLLTSLVFPLASLAVIWTVYLLCLEFDLEPGDYGVIPRSQYGLRGVFTSPLVHGSLGHIVSNSLPLFILSTMTFYFYERVAFRAFWMIYVVTGVTVWLLARPVSHIGASGVVYGLVTFLFANGIFRRSIRSIVLALFVMFFYSGMFMGILPNQEGISWESHFLGSLAGILASFWFKTELEDDEVKQDPFAEDRNKEKEYFFERGVFEKTKAQRAEEQRLREEQEFLARQQAPPPFWNQNSTWFP